jgi:hypothetical protein
MAVSTTCRKLWPVYGYVYIVEDTRRDIFQHGWQSDTRLVLHRLRHLHIFLCLLVSTLLFTFHFYWIGVVVWILAMQKSGMEVVTHWQCAYVDTRNRTTNAVVNAFGWTRVVSGWLRANEVSVRNIWRYCVEINRKDRPQWRYLLACSSSHVGHSSHNNSHTLLLLRSLFRVTTSVTMLHGEAKWDWAWLRGTQEHERTKFFCFF